MGIFDDAIREHLELKRTAGADEDELKELEDEAFGLPSRPGEPDFPGSPGEGAPEDPAPEGETLGDLVSETPPEGVSAPRNETVGALQEAPEVKPEEEPGAPEPEPEPEAPAPEGPEAGTPVEDFEAPDETFSKPFDAFADSEPLEEEDPATSFTTAEREAIADQPTVFFEQQEPAELELGDLDLDLDDELEEVGDTIDEPLAGEEPLAVEETFVEEPAVVEPVELSHEVEPEPEPEPEPQFEPETELQPETELAPEAEVVEAEPGGSDLDEAENDEPAGEEDVLEETPEFLRDNPDDDELWFEQGAPKDFDF